MTSRTDAMTARPRLTGSRNYSPESTEAVSPVQVALGRQLRESADNSGSAVFRFINSLDVQPSPAAETAADRSLLRALKDVKIFYKYF